MAALSAGFRMSSLSQNAGHFDLEILVIQITSIVVLTRQGQVPVR